MIEKKTKIKKPSASTAKQEMQTVYTEVVKELDAQREAEMKPEEKIVDKKQKVAVAAADELATEDIGKQIGALKSEIGKILSQIGDKLDAEVAKYHEVKQAVEVKEKEMLEIYDIQKSASSLTALLQAQQQRREEFDAEMAARRDELTGEIETIRAAWDEEKKRRELEIKANDTIEQKKREREREEYQYQFKREQQLAREQFEDEKSRMEREIQVRKTQVEAGLAEREKAIAERESETNELRRKVEGAPKELETAVAKAVKEATDRLVLESKNRDELAKREFAGERNVLLARIESLEKTVKDQSAQIVKLSQQLDKAYSQVQDIAVKTVEGSAAIKSLTHLEQIVTEQTKKQAQEK